MEYNILEEAKGASLNSHGTLSVVGLAERNNCGGRPGFIEEANNERKNFKNEIPDSSLEPA